MKATPTKLILSVSELENALANLKKIARNGTASTMIVEFETTPCLDRNRIYSHRCTAQLSETGEQVGLVGNPFIAAFDPERFNSVGPIINASVRG